MSTKVTFVAPANIALIKYWGARDLQRTLPYNKSLSMTLSVCLTRTTVSIEPEGAPDRVQLSDGSGNLRQAPPEFEDRIRRHLERLRSWAGVGSRLRVATENSFPAGAGLASSASGFAALTLAVTEALGVRASARDLSDLARRSGSGSAARSVLGGFVEWPAAEGEGRAHAVQVASPGHWDLRDVIAVVNSEQKEVSSRDGHRRASTSPYFSTRLELLPDRLQKVRRAIEERDFETLAPLVEEEAIDLHVIAMTSKPPIFYWKPPTLAVLDAVRTLRRDGLPVCATMDAGANVHALCPTEAAQQVAEILVRLPSVRAVIMDRIGKGPQAISDHLF